MATPTLTKDHQKTKDEAAASVREAQNAFEDAVRVFNDEMQSPLLKLELAKEKYDGAVADAANVLGEIAGTLRYDWDDKSEKWQESDSGQEISSLIDEWERIDLASLDDLGFELPQPLDCPDFEEADKIDGLPDEL